METTSEVSEHRLYRGKEAYLSIIYSRWRKLHIGIITVALFASFTACFTFVVFENKFNPYCPLYAEMRINRVQMEDNSISYVVLQMGQPDLVTVWGPDMACGFLLYAPLVNVLVAVIWILLFCIGAGTRPNFQAKLVPSTCICGLIVTSISFVASVVISRGGGTFCESFRMTELMKCTTAQYVNWVNFPKMHGFYDYLLRCQITSWLSTHAWFFHSMMALIRWITNADYVIAGEREMLEKPLGSILGSSSFSQLQENANEDDDES